MWKNDLMTGLHITGASEGLVIPSKEGLPINTITLKWCTPKSSVQGKQLSLIRHSDSKATLIFCR